MAQVGQMERFLGVHEKSHHLVKEQKGENDQNIATCPLVAICFLENGLLKNEVFEWLICEKYYLEILSVCSVNNLIIILFCAYDKTQP